MTPRRTPRLGREGSRDDGRRSAPPPVDIAMVNDERIDHITPQPVRAFDRADRDRMDRANASSSIANRREPRACRLLRTLLLNGTLGLAGYWSARHGFRMPPGLPRGLAAFTLAWAWATLGMEILGPRVPDVRPAPGLDRGRAASRACASAVGEPARREARREPRPRLATRPWEAAAILALGLVVWATTGPRPELAAGAGQGRQRRADLSPLLRGAVVEGGAALPGGGPVRRRVVTYFPAVGDLWFAWLMVGWGGDGWRRSASCRSCSWRRLAAFAAPGGSARGSRRRSSRPAWFVTVLPFLLFTLEPNVDTIFVAGYLLAAYFFLRYALGDDGRRRSSSAPWRSAASWGRSRPGSSSAASCSGPRPWPSSLRRTSLRQALGHLVAPRRCSPGHGRVLVRPECLADRQPALSPAPARPSGASGWRAGTART